MANHMDWTHSFASPVV